MLLILFLVKVRGKPSKGFTALRSLHNQICFFSSNFSIYYHAWASGRPAASQLWHHLWFAAHHAVPASAPDNRFWMHSWFILPGIVPSLPSSWIWQVNHLTFFAPHPGLPLRSLVSYQVKLYIDRKKFVLELWLSLSLEDVHIFSDEEMKAIQSLFPQVHLASPQQNEKGRCVLLIPSCVNDSLGLLLYSSELLCLQWRVIMFEFSLTLRFSELIPKF